MSCVRFVIGLLVIIDPLGGCGICEIVYRLLYLFLIFLYPIFSERVMPWQIVLLLAALTRIRSYSVHCFTNLYKEQR